MPTLAIAAAAAKLLVHEQERMEQAARASALGGARTMADVVQMTVETVEGELMQALREIPRNRLVEQLRTWEESNPLVRNVFAWNPRTGLLYPPAGTGATSEERRFVLRYSGLFSGRVPWQSPRSDSQKAPDAPDKQRGGGTTGTGEGATSQSGLVKDVRRLLSGRSELQQLAAGKIRGQAHVAENWSGGWIPWFSENRLHILGWVRRPEDELVYGVELELMALLARLMEGLPSSAPEAAVYTLVDGEGNVLHQTGESTDRSSAKPGLTIPLASQLPHWQLSVHFGDIPSTYGTRAFVFLAGALLATFVASIVLGGTLLTWQAHRNMLEVRQKASFVSKVSHALKTPLTSIRLYAELLGGDRISDPDKKKQYLQVIVDESLRLSRLVDNILDFSGLEQGRKMYNRQELNLTEFLETLLNAQRLRLQEAGLRLDLTVAGGPLLVRTDQAALESAILNIVDNAVKYAAQGGELVVIAENLSSGYRISVMDRGPGIPPAHWEAIFQEFHRVNDSLSADQRGTGLGLAIARRTVRDLGGDVTYEPRPGGGSCFVVFLPHREERSPGELTA